MTTAERAALLEVMRWVIRLEEDSGRDLNMASPTAAKLRELRERIAAEAEP